jgi:NADH-quinone oxidoreductase subunit N
MWFDEPADTAPLAVNADTSLVLGLNALAVVAMGMMPGPLLNACLDAMRKTLAA